MCHTEFEIRIKVRNATAIIVMEQGMRNATVIIIIIMKQGT
jgi:hypothetical protein